MTPDHSEPRILISASHKGLRDELVRLLADHAAITAGAGGSSVLELLDRLPSLRLMIAVENPGDDSTLDLVQAAKARHDYLAVLVLSTEPTIEHATEAIRRGAEDFVAVPYSTEVLRKEVDRVLEAAELRDRVVQLRSLVSSAYGFDQIVSNSARMRPVFERALAAARSDTPVLITGETGTGKELLARAIHANGRRRDRPFVPVNCPALPRDLVESELFGHRRGAFSGAHADHLGLFLSAHRGTLLLDEIGELSGDAQAKLLRVLQDGEIRPVGGLESRTVDVRIIAATNRSLRELRAGGFRQDLFFRLSVLVIEVPPLRERLDDLPRLIEHFLGRYRSRGATHLQGVDAKALDLLIEYPFPGNVRELESLVESLSIILPPERTTIRAEDVRAWLRRQGVRGPAGSHDDLPMKLSELEAWAIRAALARAGGNKSRAADLLGTSRDTLYRKLHQLEKPDRRQLSDSQTHSRSTYRKK
jgi:DNA-binding NtrC family response regulator